MIKVRGYTPIFIRSDYSRSIVYAARKFNNQFIHCKVRSAPE